MMPLTLANMGEEQIIRKVGGSPEVKKHLEDMGFVPGGNVTVVSALGGNVIVKVKEARVAISEEMATLPFICMRPKSAACAATVRRLIMRETFRYLSSLMLCLL